MSDPVVDPRISVIASRSGGMGRSLLSAVVRSADRPQLAIAHARSRDRRQWIRGGADANLALECANGISTPCSSFIALRAGFNHTSRERRADCSDRNTYKTDIEQRFRRKQARGSLNNDGESTRFARFSSSPVL